MSNTAGEKLLIHAMNMEPAALEFIPEGRKLKSGRLSPYFFNSGLFNKGKDVNILAAAYAETIKKYFPKIDIIFGPAYKGIPLASSIVTVLNDNTAYSCNRKEEKDHGDGGIIMGASLNGKSVALVDDVMTTGTSIIEAMDIVNIQGGKVEGVIISFDRQEKVDGSDMSAVQNFQNKYNIPVYSAVNLDILIHLLETMDTYSEDLKRIIAYKREYGITTFQ
jgi:orotate phosphoribosyltransferase